MAQEAGDIIDTLPEELRSLAEALRQVTHEYIAHISTSPVAEAHVLLRSLKKQDVAKRLRTLRDSLNGLSGSERMAALQEFQTILKELSTSTS